ncbi:MAG: SCO family protein [Phycisphaeraceae bacterium]|nr:SCO family protein [Phycisphaeraceae bacterium]
MKRTICHRLGYLTTALGLTAVLGLWACTTVRVTPLAEGGESSPATVREEGPIAATQPVAATPEAEGVSPAEKFGAKVTEKLGQAVPLELTFKDENGQTVTLGQFFRAGKPVVLQLGYYGCPMLCGLVTNGLTEAMQELSWTAGAEFAVIVVSIDPNETPRLAREKKHNYLMELARPEAGAGWHFLTGRPAEIKALSEAVGFGYGWDARSMQFVHPAVIMLLTPEGKISRYLYGVKFPSQVLRLSLVEAAEGKVGSTYDRILLYCFHYDPEAGGYRLAAMNLMRLGGVLTVVVMVSLIGLALWREARRRAAEAFASRSLKNLSR